jgi:aspartate/methionine/tyrosine aminotransferase
MLALLDPGDEVLVPDPAWFHYRTLIRLCGPKPVGMPVKFENDTSSLDLEETKRRVTKVPQAGYTICMELLGFPFLDSCASVPGPILGSVSFHH